MLTSKRGVLEYGLLSILDIQMNVCVHVQDVQDVLKLWSHTDGMMCLPIARKLLSGPSIYSGGLKHVQ